MWCVNNRIIPNHLQPNHNQRHKRNNNLSNKTVARIINELIPTAHATQGSVTSLVWNYNKNNLRNKYSKELEELLIND